MTTYNSYEAAKIANPDKEILTDHKKVEFTAELGLNYYHKCNPADYCMTVERFLGDGHKFVEGDVYLETDGDTYDVEINFVDMMNEMHELDCHRYILRAAALEENEPELTKDDSPQGVISAISNRLHNIGCEHQDSELGEELGSMACDIWGVLPLISNESIQDKKPRTKVEYVKVDISDVGFSDVADLFFMESDGNFVEIGDIDAAKLITDKWKLHRRIETPMTWKEELYDYLDSSCEMSDDFDDSFTIEIEGKPLEFNLNDDEFVDMCKFVASLNSVS